VMGFCTDEQFPPLVAVEKSGQQSVTEIVWRTTAAYVCLSRAALARFVEIAGADVLNCSGAAVDRPIRAGDNAISCREITARFTANSFLFVQY
jgi:hypothetical protein